jgi:hypothetical protein
MGATFVERARPRLPASIFRSGIVYTVRRTHCQKQSTEQIFETSTGEKQYLHAARTLVAGV